MEKQSNAKGRPIFIVVAIILVVAAAIAFRYVQRSRISANEALAVESLRLINSAEMTYATTYETGFSPSLSALAGSASPPTPSAAGLLRNDVVSGQTSGYSFVYSGLTSGGRYDTYSVTASPLDGAGHGNFYFTDQSGLIRQSTTRPATGDDPVIPSDSSSNANGNPANAVPSDPTRVPPLGPTEVLKLNSAFDAIVPPDVHLEALADLGVDRGALTEGPVWIRKGGYLLFSEIAGNVIDKWTPDGKITVFLKDSGYTGTEPSTVGKLTHNGRALLRLIGSVGITVDPQGRIVFCAQGDRAIVRLEPDGKRTVLVDRFEGKRLNSPNDLVYKSDGALYFSDPSGGLQRGDNDPKNELQFNGVFLFKDGKLRLIDKGYSVPNGVALTPDQKYLYINYTMKKTIKRFKILPDDTIEKGEIFIDMSSDKHRGAPDGMKSDTQGNLYCSGPGGLWIMSPTGTLLGIIKTPKRLTNIAFGGTDGRTLFMTTHTGELYRVRLKVAGVVP